MEYVKAKKYDVNVDNADCKILSDAIKLLNEWINILYETGCDTIRCVDAGKFEFYETDNLEETVKMLTNLMSAYEME